MERIANHVKGIGSKIGLTIKIKILIWGRDGDISGK
jgi:hypothetical protein